MTIDSSLLWCHPAAASTCRFGLSYRQTSSSAPQGLHTYCCLWPYESFFNIITPAYAILPTNFIDEDSVCSCVLLSFPGFRTAKQPQLGGLRPTSIGLLSTNRIKRTIINLARLVRNVACGRAAAPHSLE